MNHRQTLVLLRMMLRWGQTVIATAGPLAGLTRRLSNVEDGEIEATLRSTASSLSATAAEMVAVADGIAKGAPPS